MKLSRPAAPFERVGIHGESVTLDTLGKVLVLPTGSDVLLPSFNEYVLNSNRLTIAESPFGGIKGSGSPDYAPGTLYTPTDGVYLTDTSGTNSTKTLTAGKLKELGLLTVDTAAHSITEEFIVENTGTSNNPTVIADGSDASTWAVSTGTGNVTSENGRLKVVGESSTSSGLKIVKTGVSLTNQHFFCFRIQCSVEKNLFLQLSQSSNYIQWRGSRFPISANVDTTFVLPIRTPQGTTGVSVSGSSGTIDWNNNIVVYIGTDGEDATEITFYIDDVTADTAKTATIELQTPNNLAATSTIIQCYSGSTYSECRRDSLDSTYSNISSTPANMKLLDGTLFDHVYGNNLGRAYFPKGSAGETKAGSTGNITYSANKGTDKRIGLTVDLPPSDGGRTRFNCFRGKITTYYTADAGGNYSASCDFADSTNTSYGLQNISKPWIALYSPESSIIDFYLFTHRPKQLECKRDESGEIYELKLYPGNGQIYHGQITYSDLTRDTNSDTIPDCLESSIEGSVTKLLRGYTTIDKNTIPTVYGFWANTINPAVYQPDWTKLTHICYTSWEVNIDGTLTPPSNMSYFTQMLATAHEHGIKVVIMALSGNVTTIDTVLANNSTALVNNILSVIQSTGADGVNIDFEFPGTVNSVTHGDNTDLFCTFMQSLHTTLKASNPDYHISLDVDRNIIVPFRNPDLVQYLDHIFLMTYQYNYGSLVTRSSAPMYDPNHFSVNDTINRALEFYPNEKIIFGLSWYGKDYTTYGDFSGAEIIAQVRYPQMMDTLAEATVYGRKWDPTSNTPFYAFQVDGVWHQVWYEDNTSIKIKCIYAKSLEINGVGFMCLGMEGNNSVVWDVFPA